MEEFQEGDKVLIVDNEVQYLNRSMQSLVGLTGIVSKADSAFTSVCVKKNNMNCSFIWHNSNLINISRTYDFSIDQEVVPTKGYKNYFGWTVTDTMKKYIGQKHIVRLIYDNLMVLRNINGEQWYWPKGCVMPYEEYIKVHKAQEQPELEEPKFQIGDKVKASQFSLKEHGIGWNPDMEKYVGTVGKITNVGKGSYNGHPHCYCIDFGDNDEERYCWPEAALAKANQFKKGDWVLTPEKLPTYIPSQYLSIAGTKQQIEDILPHPERIRVCGLIWRTADLIPTAPPKPPKATVNQSAQTSSDGVRLPIGTTVLISDKRRISPKEFHGLGFIAAMETELGKIGKITGYGPNSCYIVQTETGEWHWPISWITKYEEETKAELPVKMPTSGTSVTTTEKKQQTKKPIRFIDEEESFSLKIKTKTIINFKQED